MPTPKTPPDPIQEDYDDFLEWTEEEEDEFLRILDEQPKKDVTEE